MKYLIVALLLVLSCYPLSYVKYNWKRKNKLGALGVLLLVVLQIVFPAVFLFMR